MKNTKKNGDTFDFNVEHVFGDCWCRFLELVFE